MSKSLKEMVAEHLGRDVSELDKPLPHVSHEKQDKEFDKWLASENGVRKVGNRVLNNLSRNWSLYLGAALGAATATIGPKVVKYYWSDIVNYFSNF